MTEALLSTYGPFMTVTDLAQVLNVSNRTLYNKSSAGQLDVPHYKLGKKLLFPTPAVADYINSKLTQ